MAAALLETVTLRGHAIVPTLPKAFDAVVLRALEKKANDRYDDAAEMRRSLLAVPTGVSLLDRSRPWAAFAGVFVVVAAILFLAGLAITHFTKLF